MGESESNRERERDSEIEKGETRGKERENSSYFCIFINFYYHNTCDRKSRKRNTNVNIHYQCTFELQIYLNFCFLQDKRCDSILVMSRFPCDVTRMSRISQTDKWFYLWAVKSRLNFVQYWEEEYRILKRSVGWYRRRRNKTDNIIQFIFLLMTLRRCTLCRTTHWSFVICVLVFENNNRGHPASDRTQLATNGNKCVVNEFIKCVPYAIRITHHTSKINRIVGSRKTNKLFNLTTHSKCKIT